jgi:hypothetical protein
MRRVTMDAYVLDVLMRDLVGHDRRPAAYVVLLWLWGRGAARRGTGVRASLREIAEHTGLSKRAVQDGLAHLARRRLLQASRVSATAVPVYALLRPWARRARAMP